jgi:hypothetical protein
MFVSLAIIVILASPQLVAGWGADTHPTIGYLAESFLLDPTVPTALCATQLTENRRNVLQPFLKENLNFTDLLAVPQIGLIARGIVQLKDGILLTLKMSCSLNTNQANCK